MSITRGDAQSALRQAIANMALQTPVAVKANGKAPPIFVYTLAKNIRPDLTTTAVVRNLVPRRAFGVIYGEPGSGKTAIIVDLMLHIADGRAYRGRQTERQPVVYVALEGHGGINNRVAAALAHLGIKDVPFALVKVSCSFRDPEAARKAAATAKELMQLYSGDNPIIVLDTYTAALGAGGSDCNPEDVTAFLENIKVNLLSVGCTVLAVHHCGKDAGRGARGWSGLFAACDFEMEVGRNKALRTMHVSKMRDGDDDQAGMCYRLIGYQLGVHAQYGDPVTAVVVEHLKDSTAGSKSKKRSSKAAAAYRILWKMIKDPTLSFPLPGQPGLRCVIINKWEDECLNETAISTNRRERERRAQFHAAVEELISLGDVINEGGRVSPKPKPKHATDQDESGDEPEDEPEDDA